MAAAEATAGQRRALLVATGDYSDPGLAALRAPTGDVQSLAAVLSDGAIGGFEVRELIDRPTEELKREIETFFGSGRPKDLMLLYVSGHGVLSQNRRFYLATTTTALTLLRSTAIEDSFVNDVMQQSRARSIVLVLDCCHSGAFGKGVVPKSALSVDVEHRFEGRGRITLTASTELEYAFEESDPATGINDLHAGAPGSLFTRSVVEGLRTGEADIDDDGQISVDDLYDYVCRRVRERSPNQTPGMAGDVRGQIVLARSPRRPQLPPELARAAESNLAGIREGAAAELGQLLQTAPAGVAQAAREALERLAEDDSRRVAAAALAALGRGAPPEETVALPPEPEPEPPEPQPPPPPPQRPRPEPERDRESRGRRWPLLAGIGGGIVVAAVVAVLLLGGSDPGPTPQTAATPYAFDGGNRQDVVMGLAIAAKAGEPKEVSSGVVMVGTADNRIKLLTGADSGVPRPLEPTDRFGTAVASADFDRDGRADLAISAPGKDGLAVRYGLDDRKQWIPAGDLPGSRETHGLGFALVAADFDHDGFTDLAAGTPGTKQERTDWNTGSIDILFGGPDGLTAHNVRRLKDWTTNESAIGSRLAAGDIDRDGDVDLVEGSAKDSRTSAPGHFSYCEGTPTGPRTCRDIKGYATSSLAIADVDGDHYPDVVQGDAFADSGGVVRLWRGGKKGLAAQPTAVDQGTHDIQGDPQAGDEFGHDVIAADLDDDGRAEVIVAARSDEEGAGSVTVIPGDASKFGGSGGIQLQHIAPKGAHLGATLSLLDVDGDQRPELFVGVKSAPTADDALVVYPGVEGGFGKGEAVTTGGDDLATVSPNSPLRIGR